MARRRIKPWLLLLFILIIWVGIGFAKNAYGNYKLKQKIRDLEKEIAIQRLRGEELEEEIVEWESPENIERVAREELGLVKPGEVMYILSEPITDDIDLDVKKR
ncbi:MAG: septum formation initiator family protein [Bacillota bacterium]|nr:septum formation initiator family protein [Bacillota bacterium]HHU62049.1 septum formation initiator family protein [Natronincola sp.]